MISDHRYMEQNNLFPIFLKLEKTQTLLVGGGNVGLEKISALLKSSPQANVTLVAGVIRDEIKALAEAHPTVTLIERNFTLNDLLDKDIVILATDNKELHVSICKAARDKKILVNVADTPDLCDFYLGAVVSKGNLKIGISTNGKSPTLAKRMREYLEEAIPDTVNSLLDNLQAVRNKLKGDFRTKVKLMNEVTEAWLNSPSSRKSD
jgi:precorrin-2 dehydrogenase / sirohydrochlorin ferrochelatase